MRDFGLAASFLLGRRTLYHDAWPDEYPERPFEVLTLEYKDQNRK